MCPGAEVGISNFFKRKQDDNIGSTIVPFGIQGGGGGVGEGAEGNFK